MKVYILSTYDEHGAENVRATIDKNEVADIAAKMYLELWKCNAGRDRSEEFTKLSELLDADVLSGKNGTDLADGWGGMQLHIVELE